MVPLEVAEVNGFSSSQKDVGLFQKETELKIKI